MFVCGRRLGREGGGYREEREKDTREKEGEREEFRPRKRTVVLSNKQMAACPRVFPNTLLDHDVCKHWEQILLHSFGP